MSKKKWLSVLIREKKFPKKEMCHFSQDKLKREICHLKREIGNNKKVFEM